MQVTLKKGGNSKDVLSFHELEIDGIEFRAWKLSETLRGCWLVYHMDFENPEDKDRWLVYLVRPNGIYRANRGCLDGGAILEREFIQEDVSQFYSIFNLLEDSNV